MSKSIVIIVIAVIALVAAGGAYHFVRQEASSNDKSPAVTDPANQPASIAPIAPKPDHGNFQNRFQPSMPPSDK